MVATHGPRARQSSTASQPNLIAAIQMQGSFYQCEDNSYASSN